MTKRQSWAYFCARLRIAWRRLRIFIIKQWRRLKRWFEWRVLRRHELMVLRHDYCRSHVKNPRKTVIFLHGILSSFDTWNEIAKTLENDKDLADCRFIGLDLVGYGHSLAPADFKYNYQDYRDALQQFICRMHIKTPLILVGHSMGSLIAMDYALAKSAQVESLVLVSPPILRRAEIGKFSDKIRQKIYAILGKKSEDETLQKAADIVSDFTQFDSASFKTPAFRLCMENIILNPENWRRAFALKNKTILIHGRFDPFVVGDNLRVLASRNKQVEFVQTVGAHDMSGLKAKKIVQLITSLLGAES